MKNYKITVEYDGTRYAGWQRQGNAKDTIQEKFEQVLSKMCGKKTEIFASGRTDRGVHALGQVANFKCEVEMSLGEVKDYLNHYLPRDIRVKEISEADARFHSRLSAKGKAYEYRIAVGKPSVFSRKFVYAQEERPDLNLMKSAAEKLLGTHDFLGFSSLGKSKKSTVRTISSIDISEEDGIFIFRLTGTGFLYHMVRILVGTLFDIGTEKLPESVIDEVLKTGVRSHAGTTLPAEGLTLLEVYYE